MFTHVAMLFWRGFIESSDSTNFQLFILARHQPPAYIGCTADKLCVLLGWESPIMHANAARQCETLNAYLRFSYKIILAHKQL